MLQKTEILVYVRFNKVCYSQSDAISGLPIERFNMEDLIKNYLNILIWTIKSMNKKVIGVEAFEQ